RPTPTSAAFSVSAIRPGLAGCSRTSIPSGQRISCATACAWRSAMDSDSRLPRISCAEQSRTLRTMTDDQAMIDHTTTDTATRQRPRAAAGQLPFIDVCGTFFDRDAWEGFLLALLESAPQYFWKFRDRFVSLSGADPQAY